MARESRPLNTSLHAIKNDWALLQEEMAAHAHGSSALGGGPAGGGEKLPGGTAAIALARDISHNIHYYARKVLTEHDEPEPTDGLGAHDPAGVAAWLALHSDWLAADTDDLATDDFDDLAERLERLLRPVKIRRPLVGACPVAHCVGHVRGYVDDSAPECPESRDVVCDLAGEHRWDKAKWAELGRLMGHFDDHDAPEKMTSPQLAAWMSTRFRRTVKDWEIRKWAERDPLTLRKDPETGKFDRVVFATWFLEKHGAYAERRSGVTLGEQGPVAAGYGW